MLITPHLVAGFSLYSLQSIRDLFSNSPAHSQPKLEPDLTVATPARVDFLRFGLGDKALVAGLKDGSVQVYRLKNLAQNNVSPISTAVSSGPNRHPRHQANPP